MFNIDFMFNFMFFAFADLEKALIGSPEVVKWAKRKLSVMYD